MRKLTAGVQTVCTTTAKPTSHLVRRSLSSAFALLLLCSSMSAVADIYRWIDARGIVNYTQQKPNDVPSTLVGKATSAPSQSAARPAQTSSATSARQAQLTPAQQQRLDELKANEQEQAEQLAVRQEANCNRAQSVLEQLTTNNRIRIRGDDGTVRAIGEDERQSRIEETQLSIAENCVS